MMRPTPLFAILTILIGLHSIVLAQASYDLSPKDTLIYHMKANKVEFVSIKSPEANLAISVHVADKKVYTQNESHGLGSTERILLQPNQQPYTIKIWADAYHAQTKPVKVWIEKQTEFKPMDTHIASNLLLEDLRLFRAIREKSNAGMYIYHTQATFDSLYAQAEKEVASCNNLLRFYQIIAKLTHAEGSCHNYTRLPNATHYYLQNPSAKLPFNVVNINGVLYNKTPLTNLPLGAQIISINGIPTPDIIQNLTQFYNADGYVRSYAQVAPFDKGWPLIYHLAYGTSASYQVEYTWEGNQKTTTLSGSDFYKSFTPDVTSPSAPRYSFQKLDPNLYSLKISGFDFAGSADDPNYLAFEKLLEHMMDTLLGNPKSELIVDLRGNQGGAGFLYEKVFTYLTDRPFRDSEYAYTLFNEIPFKQHLVISRMLLDNDAKNGADVDVYLKSIYPVSAQGKFYWNNEKNALILPNERTFKGPLYLFTDEYVASAGSHLASLIKSYTPAVVLGRETAGGYYDHNGHLPLSYVLPHSGIITGFSIVYVKQDAQKLADQPKGSGIMPHYAVQSTFEQHIQGEDVHLNKLKSIRAKANE
jgi:hypothetical protein